MGITALVGCQWGDEGKGKIVDILSGRVEMVARFQGGANAGHTVVIDDQTQVLHLLPVGILRPGVSCVLGNGMVIDLEALITELESVGRSGVHAAGRLFISPRAHVILPYHKAVEKEREESWSRPIGTTLRGIGPAYETKAMRSGVRIGDLFRPERLRSAVAALHDWALISGCDEDSLPPRAAVLRRLEELGAEVRPHVCDTSALVREMAARGGEVLLEGAQGTLLDQDHGTYPYVTSSSTAVGGAVTGLGFSPRAIARIIGVTKAYVTRVGEGPFPTEFDGPVANEFRERAGEFGATTGRPRRCGWLDGVLLRYAAEVNGLTALVITKLDVLDGMETIRVATSYTGRGSGSSGAGAAASEHVDVIDALAECDPIYEDLPGWSGSTSGVTEWSKLPANAQAYLRRVEEIAGVPVAMVSTGNRRDQIVVVRDDLLPGHAGHGGSQ